MNNLTRLISRLAVSTTHRVITSPQCTSSTRGFTSLTSASAQAPASSVLSVKSLDIQSTRGYKVKQVLKRRCAGCYYERRFGRLYIECKVKPRHKQMQLVQGMGYFKDHYSKGKWQKAIHWGYKNQGRFHKWGDSSDFSRFNWLEGRLGKEI